MDAAEHPPPRPDRPERPTGPNGPEGPEPHPTLPAAAWIAMAGASAISLIAIAAMPRSGADRPPVATLAFVAVVVSAAFSAALVWIVHRELRLPIRVAVAFGAAFALIGIVKFALGPHGLYDVNADRELQDAFGTVADPVGAIVAGAAILAIYAFVYRVLFRVTVGRRRARERRKAVALYVVIGIVVLPFVFGAALLVLVASPFQYLSFVFSSGVAATVVFILVVAGGLITVSFRSVARSTEDVAGTGSLLTLFWLGLAFLVLFHVLWVVYMVVLGSIWPLRTVVPK